MIFMAVRKSLRGLFLVPQGRLLIATRRKPVGNVCLHRRAPAGRLKVSVAPLGLRINECGVHGLAPRG